LSYPDQQTTQNLRLDQYPESKPGMGPLHASFTGTADDPMPAAWFEGFKSIGFAPITDPFSGTVQGAFTCASSIDAQAKTRTHSGLAYYAPIKDRPNLVLKTGAIVDKIILEKIDGSGIVTRGVQWKLDGTRQEAIAAKEVILAAGAFGSPKLLELSGIGRPDVLKNAGIEIIVNSPSVGRNL
jgi:choline dehydrogenase-like flavoprotein